MHTQISTKCPVHDDIIEFSFNENSPNLEINNIGAEVSSYLNKEQAIKLHELLGKFIKK